jgi:Branched-chain amino acid transport system / permease component
MIMGFLAFYLRKLYSIVRNEILVLPSRVVVVLFCLFLLLLPLFYKDPYVLRILIQASIFAILAASWDLLSGFTGQMNFGHALFFGVGAYTAALLNLHLHVPPWGSIPLGALAAVFAGLVIGIPCLRLKGTYLALTTLAFPIILMGIVFTLPGITGGELGVSGISRLSGSRMGDYYITVVLMLGLTTIMWKITDSKTGIIFQHHPIQASGLQPERLFCRPVRWALRPFHEDCRSLHPGSRLVLHRGDLGCVRGDCNHLRPGGGGLYSFSASGVSAVLARVPDLDVRCSDPVDPSVHARGPDPLGPRQNREGVPQVQA